MAEPARDSIAEEFEDEGIPGLDDEDPAIGGQIPPRDHPQGASEYGVTAAEQATDEPISERHLRERPDELAATEDATGRTIAPEEGDAYGDETKDEVAQETADRSGLSAEEAAMHETEAPERR